MGTIAGQLSDLKQRYVERMPDRIAAIASTLDECVDGGRDPMDRLERQFHTLGGTAGTYGLDAVAAAAFEGEAACVELEESPLDRESLTYLTFLVDQLRGALAADAPDQWSARTVLNAADAKGAAADPTGVSVA